MCGIDFVIGVTDKEASKAERYVKFEEETHNYLTRETNKNKNFSLLINLDRYKQTVLYTNEINELILICEELLMKYKMESETEQAIRNFAQELKELCEEAIQKKKHIYAIGD
ncbi:hypothetical protein [Cytobacillus sp. FSL H8-0458]|uniref:hypothetical protein n=1 Tax=Cytobacillus sp. FSL H8-0458 TaxID=2975346 RepID=UPI0030F62AD6